MVLAKKYVVKSPFEGIPKKNDFEIVEEHLHALRDGENKITLATLGLLDSEVMKELTPPIGDKARNLGKWNALTVIAEFLAEAEYLSVDPYQRMKLGNKFPCDMIGGQIAKIIESKNPDYPVGAWVMGHFGWRTHTVARPEDAQYCGQKPYLYVLPDFGELPVSLGLGVCGRVGNTAYFGLKEICRPEPGETVVVSAAAGAVGSHVGQISKILGCRVIGFAGTNEKCDWLVKELGFDFAGNYKKLKIAEYLKKTAPNGVDCYFDNVGGELSSEVISQMNQYGRVAVCGAISAYNETNPDKLKATIVQPFIVSKQLKIEGFQVNRFADRTMQGILQNLEWVKEGKLKFKEHIFSGFESAVDAFIGLFEGTNTGKAIVKVK